ncbi:MAG: hypothetical protein AAF561_00075 [Planctomycetota bacterium]
MTAAALNLDDAAALDRLGIVNLTPPKPPDDKPRCDQLDHADARHLTIVQKRRMIELQRGQAAAERLDRLPSQNEALHVLMDGSFDGIDLLDAVLALIEPVIVDRLVIATLSFNERVMRRLLDHIDAGRVGTCTFCCSALFEGKERHLVDKLRGELERRGGTFTIERNHTKLMLFATSDGRHLVVEGSQNLRTCRCYEQFVVSQDATLFDFYVDFIERTQTDG